MIESYNSEVPAGLFEKILNRIHREQRIIVIRNTILICIAFFASLIAIVPSFAMLSSDASQSGFLNFSSLMFSDSSVILTYWRSFSLALLETLPVISLAVFLLIVVVFLQSLRSLVKNLKTLNNTRFARAS